LRIAGVDCVADVSGALYWPQQDLLAVSDLHLEKGSAFAARGSLLPPYDTADTLARLSRLIARYAPRTVIALGDSFHDNGGVVRIAEADRASLRTLQRGRDWVWITGNHDPAPLDGIGGDGAESVAIGPLTFRHIGVGVGPEGEISGHLHPVAVVVARGRGLRRRCFATDGRRMVMPAFGAYAGGLNIRHRAFAKVFDGHAFTAHVMGDDRVFAIAAMRCVG
jgi:DNA ligase-associated metallophosphoesterase